MQHKAGKFFEGSWSPTRPPWDRRSAVWVLRERHGELIAKLLEELLLLVKPFWFLHFHL